MTLVKHQEEAAGCRSVFTDKLVDLSGKEFTEVSLKHHELEAPSERVLEALTFICLTNGETQNLLGF